MRFCQDVRAFLAASEAGQFDLVVAAETLQYLGPVEGVFADAFKVLKPGGYFSFTVDRRKVEGEGGEDEEEGGDGGGEQPRINQVGRRAGGDYGKATSADVWGESTIDRNLMWVGFRSS